MITKRCPSPFGVATALFFLTCGSLGAKEITFRKAKLKINNQIVMIEIAEREEQRNQGLMYRKKLNKNHGMLFIFQNEKKLSFWMKNTWVKLDIGFFDKEKRLINVRTMQPSTSVMQTDLPSYKSSKNALYALEMNAGWFKKNSIKSGSKFKILK